jgi:predicted TIM-barrel enzyme
MSKFKKIVDEYGTEGTTGTVGTTGTTGTDGEKPDAEQLKNVAQATSTLKQATGSVVQPGALAKAIDAASQGKTTSQQDMKALEPMMDIIKTTAENPELANQMKPLIQRAKQLQQKP